MIDEMEKFFAFARERHRIYLRRASGQPYPWTGDKVLQTGRFTNVYRELDRTTAWFKKHVREPMRSRPEVLLATIVFRWFNRTTTGEAIFLQPCLPGGPGEPAMTAFDELLATGSTAPLRHAILKYCGAGPYITGAYTINTRSAGLGLTKLDGVLKLIDMWWERHSGDPMTHWKEIAEHLISGNYRSMEEFCAWAKSPCLAGFMTYEVACDLRYTDLLDNALDRLTWANPGPGAVRGLNRIHGRPVNSALKEPHAVGEIAELLAVARTDGHYWPPLNSSLVEGTEGYTVPWEMREVEHTLCEFDKYQRVKTGQGQTRGTFRL